MGVNHRKKLRSAVFVSALALCLSLTSTARALVFQCKAPGDTRHLSVKIPGEKHLCEVAVTYENTGKRDVKWYARNDTLFCSARAYELRDKYEKLWNFTCKTLPDDDGIDILSPTQREILDERLKVHILRGSRAEPSFKVLAVRAVASTPLDKQAAKIAFQFFTDQGDFTEIVDDQIQTWKVTATIDELRDYVTSDVPLESALMHSISDEGALEVHTQLTDANGGVCNGKQIFVAIGDSGKVKARSTHRFVCLDDQQ